MAHLVPSTLPTLESERALALSLRDGLSDAFTVFLNLRYLRGTDLAEGEVDALVVHRTLGLLYIESKGMGVECDERGRWSRRYGGRTHSLKRSPSEQVSTHARAINGLLSKRMDKAVYRHGVSKVSLPWSWAIAFPFTRVGEEILLPLDLPREVVIDAADLADVGEHVEAMMRRAANAYPHDPLPAQVFDAVIRDALYPSLSLTPTLAGRIERAKQAVIRLDERQRTIIGSLADNDQFRVLGGAGTGKSLLAMEIARIWAQERERKVALVCFNRLLKDRLVEAASALDLDEDRLCVRHFHGLTYQALSALEKTNNIPHDDASSEERKHFWEDRAPQAIGEAIEAGLMPRYDALVVDEAQDLRSDWWFYLRMLLHDPDAGPLVALYDPEQAVFGREFAVPNLFTFRLVENYRNARPIAEALAGLSDQGMRAHPGAAEGEPVRVYDTLSPAKLARRIGELVTRYRNQGLRYEEMVILGPHRHPNSSLAETDNLGEHMLVHRAAERGEGLWYETVSAFKGLEAPVVFFVDVDQDDPRCGRKAQYVAASRATHALHVFPRGGGWAAKR